MPEPITDARETTALVLARALPGSGAGLPLREGSVLSRLCAQLRELGVSRIRVLEDASRSPRLADKDSAEDSVEDAAGKDRAGAGASDAETIVCRGSAEQLTRIAAFAGEAGTTGTPLVLVPGDLVAHREALAALLADPRASTGALVTSRNGAAGPAVRVEHQRLVSAGSGYHQVTAGNAIFLHAVRVGPQDTSALACAAGQLTPLVAARRLALGPELLLVGLVRAGVAVDASDARELRSRRVTGAADAAAAERELREVDEDRVLLDSAVKADDGFFTSHAVSPYSKYLARWAARRGLSPNAVTVISMGLGIAAAACFALGNRAGLVAGGVVFQLAFVADCVDGQLARYTRTLSAFGGWLDATFDRAKEYAVYAGLAAGAVISAPAGTAVAEEGLARGVWTLAVAALGLQTVRHMIDFNYAAANPRTLAGVRQRPLDEPADGFGGAAPEPRGTPGRGAGRSRSRAGRLGTAATRASRRLDGHPAARWLKKVVVLPIGERFALISVTAAVGGPRATFVALLLWGGFAGLYTLLGRVLRSLARHSPGTRPGPAETGMHDYSDDGVLISIFRTLAGGRFTRRPGRLDWLVPPLLRAGEYAVVVGATLAAGAPPVLTFALVAALVYHHYDLVYRTRQRVAPPPRWLGWASLGWDGRMLVVALAVATGTVIPVCFVLAFVLWGVFIGESVMSWARSAGNGAVSVPFDECPVE